MKIFNAFQLMLIFAVAPFLITYCKDATFYAHAVITWVLISAYLTGFGVLTALVADNL